VARRGSGSGDAPEGDEAQGEQRQPSEVRTGVALISGNRFKARAVTYIEVDGLAMAEGVIILDTVEQVAEQTSILRGELSGELSAAAIITGDQFRWPNCTVPYTVDGTLPNQQRVTDAIAHWQSNTRFRFVQRTTETNYVTFRPSSGCSSSVGMRGGEQFVNLGGDCTAGNAIHEIGHTVGLWHEQSREDRDQFVTINFAKIQAGYESNFNQHISDGDDIGAYDYGSIMHYPRDAFSVDGSDTITPTNPATAQIGQRVGLSAGDVAAANSMCPKSFKELAKDPLIDTFKELSKDIAADTRKELARDTLKEIVKDRGKEIGFDPPWTIFEVTHPGGVTAAEITVQPVTQPGWPGIMPGVQPFAVAAAHQAPAAMVGAQMDAIIPALDAQLVALAQAIGSLDAAREQLQAQYDAIDQALRQATGAGGGGGGYGGGQGGR